MARAAHSKPNIVLICSDQHACRYTGYAGHPIVKTPNMDRIARNGVVFSNTYCGSPVCTPGRACLMTGMYPSDVGSYCNSTVWDGSHPTWGTRLNKAGYDCRATGKFDLNDDFDSGFVEINVKNGHCTRPDITSLFRSPPCYRIGERIAVDGQPRQNPHGDADKTRVALDFILGESGDIDAPWLFWLGLSQPHPQFTAMQAYWDMYPAEAMDLPDIRQEDLEDLHLVYQGLRHFKRIATPIPEDRIRRARAGYYGMISELDAYIGQVWDALDQTGQLENTVFIYTSDHGESLGEHGLWYKNNLYENAAHVPLLISGPGFPRGVTVDTPVAHVDLVATLLDLSGAEISSELRGHSLLSLANGDPGDHPGWTYTESHSEGNCTGSFLIRKGDWKYIHFTWYDDLLFNLADDPGEFENRIDDPGAADILADMRGILNHLVNPEQITRDAFTAQRRVLDRLAADRTEEQFADYLGGRLGAGLGRVLAANYFAR
jgi:choline-sulfatase